MAVPSHAAWPAACPADELRAKSTSGTARGSMLWSPGSSRNSYLTLQTSNQHPDTATAGRCSPAPPAALRASLATQPNRVPPGCRDGALDAGVPASRATPKGNTIKIFSAQMFTQLKENGPLTKPQQRREPCMQRAQAHSQRAWPHPHPRRPHAKKAMLVPRSISTSAEPVLTASSD